MSDLREHFIHLARLGALGLIAVWLIALTLSFLGTRR